MRQATAPLLVVGALSVIAVALVIVPSVANNPFQQQDARTIARLYSVQSWAPAMTLALAIAGLMLTVRIWRRTASRRARSAAVTALIVLTAAALGARQYMLEWLMFAPIETVRFVDASQASHVADDDMVLGVAMSGQARAYPVLMTAYYHIVNDELDGEPYVVTY